MAETGRSASGVKEYDHEVIDSSARKIVDRTRTGGEGRRSRAAAYREKALCVIRSQHKYKD